MAEGVGFEPTRPLRVTAFQAVPLDHSGILPELKRFTLYLKTAIYSLNISDLPTFGTQKSQTLT